MRSFKLLSVLFFVGGFCSERYTPGNETGIEKLPEIADSLPGSVRGGEEHHNLQENHAAKLVQKRQANNDLLEAIYNQNTQIMNRIISVLDIVSDLKLNRGYFPKGQSNNGFFPTSPKEISDLAKRRTIFPTLVITKRPSTYFLSNSY